MSWLNSWINAEPLYHQAELQFIERHQIFQGSLRPCEPDAGTLFVFGADLQIPGVQRLVPNQVIGKELEAVLRP